MNPPQSNRFKNHHPSISSQGKEATFSTNIQSDPNGNPTLFPLRSSGVPPHLKQELTLLKVPLNLASHLGSQTQSRSLSTQKSESWTRNPEELGSSRFEQVPQIRGNQTSPVQHQKTPVASSRPSKGKTSVVRLKPAAAAQVPSVVPFPKIDNNRRQNRRPGRLTLLGLSVLRLLILGVGLGTIAGTVLANVDFKDSSFLRNLSLPELSLRSEPPIEPEMESPQSSPLSLDAEITPLKEKLETLAAQNAQLQPGAFFIDLDNGGYVDLDGESPFSAASTIKIPILVAFLQDVDAGKIRLDEALVMKPELIAAGSGDMQYQEPGKQYSALETATKMIVISDNTATNMLIERLGGAEVLNQRFQEWGLKNTAINNPLPDLEGTNTTSPKDLAQVLALVEQGELVSLRSRDRLLEIMRGTVTQTLLPQGLEAGAIIAHKTGDIGSVLGDAGIIDMPSGKRYIAAVIVKRPHNDPQGRTLIQQMSKTVYQHFKWYQPRPFTEDAFIEPVESSE